LSPSRFLFPSSPQTTYSPAVSFEKIGLTSDQSSNSSTFSLERVESFVRDLPRPVSSPNGPVEEETDFGERRESSRDDETTEEVGKSVGSKGGERD